MRPYQFHTDGQTFQVDTPWGIETGAIIQRDDGSNDYLSIGTELDEGRFYDLHNAAVKAVLAGRVGPSQHKGTSAKVSHL